MTAVSFRVLGTEPELKEELMMLMMSWELAGRQFLTSEKLLSALE